MTIPSRPGEWKFHIKHGPEGECDYAWIYDECGRFVGTTKTKYAQRIVEAVNRALPKD